MTDTVEFELWQGGLPVAKAEGSLADAAREILHYALVYSQDGPVEAFEVVRYPVRMKRLINASKELEE